MPKLDRPTVLILRRYHRAGASVTRLADSFGLSARRHRDRQRPDS